MNKMVDHNEWTLDPGKIYLREVHKRVDERPAASEARLERATLQEQQLVFESSATRDQALHDGIFLLKIPDSIDFSACDHFSRQFFTGDEALPYGRYRTMTGIRFGDPLLGYHERVNQIEQFLLERRFWQKVYPAEIEACGLALTGIAGRVLRAILMLTDVPVRDWDEATGGCSAEAGSYHLTFNHYRPSLPGIGLSSHKDDGFMTILRITSPGLEINRHDRWEAVTPDPACFIVNFGLSMEILTRRSSRPVSAIMHRVQHQTADRFSFGHFSSSFCEPGAEAGIHGYDSESGLRRICSSRELIDANDNEIYQGTQGGEAAS
ncbi:2OG-Fe(II) oxygenase family protein [Burkholderia gladioli]|uniref:2OG-Fe(II) oxygenase family protein n=1 Tax=Burkholderia gladioli TaxID=28095 RepID=UPI00163E052B|nr:2OG-Fe(II) oxygenase family protein [Burkholderia gladioli]